MLWMKAFHIIFMVTWFSGLFYLPRLFVYHAMSDDNVSHERFLVMERKLFYGIMTPGAVLTTLLGIGLVGFNPSYYLQASWFHFKLLAVVILWCYHLYCGYCYRQFRLQNNTHGHVFYRWLNEFPVLILVAVVLLVILK